MDKNRAPIQLTLYDPETNEVVSDHTRIFVPWGILKKAVGLTHMDRNNLTEEDVDMIAGIVVETFGNKFSVSDLDKGADLEEMMAVVDNIIARATLGQKGGRGVEKEKRREGEKEKGERPLPEMLREE